MALGPTYNLEPTSACRVRLELQRALDASEVEAVRDASREESAPPPVAAYRRRGGVEAGIDAIAHAG
jgi:hypothetical protein